MLSTMLMCVALCGQTAPPNPNAVLVDVYAYATYAESTLPANKAWILLDPNDNDMLGGFQLTFTLPSGVIMNRQYVHGPCTLNGGKLQGMAMYLSVQVLEGYHITGLTLVSTDAPIDPFGTNDPGLVLEHYQGWLINPH